MANLFHRSGLAALLWVAALPLSAEYLSAEHPSCQPDPILAAQLERLDPLSSECEPNRDCWSHSEAELRALAERHPEDVPLGRVFQVFETFAGRKDPAVQQALLERYDARVAAHPNDPAALYLRARLTLFESRDLLEKALRIDPAYPWAHMALATVRFRSGERDEAMADLRALIAACPSRVDLWVLFLPQVDLPPDAYVLLGQVRTALAKLPWQRRLGAIEQVWSAEMRLAGSEADPVRERIRRELAEVEQLDLQGSVRWWLAVEKGTTLLGGDLESLRRRKAAALRAAGKLVR